MIELRSSRYGKAAIRIVRVGRDTRPHRLRDMTVAIALEGDFTAAHADGDNELVVATDTMKNTAYAFAADHLTGSIEDYAAALGATSSSSTRSIGRSSTCGSTPGGRSMRGDGPAPDAFVRGGEGTRVATVAVGRDGALVEAGIEDMVVMKTDRSAFAGFPRDRFTTLPDTDDRLMATQDHARSGATARRASTSTRRGPRSSARCSRSSPITTARASSTRSGSWPRRCSSGTRSSTRSGWCCRTSITGRSTSSGSVSTNDRLVYISTSEPHGLIEATVRRSEVS